MKFDDDVSFFFHSAFLFSSILAMLFSLLESETMFSSGKTWMRGDMRERKVKNCLLQCYGKHSHLLFRAHIWMVRTHRETCETHTATSYSIGWLSEIERLTNIPRLYDSLCELIVKKWFFDCIAVVYTSHSKWTCCCTHNKNENVQRTSTTNRTTHELNWNENNEHAGSN